MASVETADDPIAGAPGVVLRSRGPWRRAFTRFRRRWLSVAALAVLIVLFAAGAFAGRLAPYGFNEYNPAAATLPPTLAGHHWFGTDEIGRDLYSRTLWGIRSSAEVGLVVAAL